MDASETIFGILSVIVISAVIFFFGCLVTEVSSDNKNALNATNTVNSAAVTNEDDFGSLSYGFKGLGIKLEGPLQINMDGTIGISLFDL